jgi:hypothetical protein
MQAHKVRYRDEYVVDFVGDDNYFLLCFTEKKATRSFRPDHLI